MPSAAQAATNASAQQWLASQNVTATVLAHYGELVQEKSAARTEDAKKEFNEMVGLYDQTKLQLIPEQYPLAFDGSFPYVHKVRAFLGFAGWCPGKAFCGMFAAAMLLTLGAPFWFNLLKSLASLRSTVKDKVDQEQKQKKPS